jgi:hypothetical protein
MLVHHNHLLVVCQMPANVGVLGTRQAKTLSHNACTRLGLS